MKKIIKIKYGDADINGIIEIEINTKINIDFNVICNIINTVYYNKNKVQLYLNDTPIMFFDKNFNTEINNDAIIKLLTKAINRCYDFENSIKDLIKENDLINTKTKEIKDEVPIYRTAEHGTNVDCKGEVPNTKCETSDNTPSKSDKYYKDGLYYKGCGKT